MNIRSFESKISRQNPGIKYESEIHVDCGIFKKVVKFYSVSNHFLNVCL